MNKNVFYNSLSSTTRLSGWGGDELAGLPVLLNFLILIALLGGCYTAAQEVGGATAKEGLKWGDKAKGWVKGKGVRAFGAAAGSWAKGEKIKEVVGRIPLAGKYLVKGGEKVGALGTKMEKIPVIGHGMRGAEWAGKKAGGFGKWAGGTLIGRETFGRGSNMLKGYLMTQASALAKANEKQYEDEKKGFADYSDDALENLKKITVKTSTNQKFLDAIVAEQAKKGELKTYDEKDIKDGALNKRLNQMTVDARKHLDNQMVDSLVKEIDSMRPDIIVEELISKLQKEQAKGAAADPKEIKKLTGKIRGKLKKAKFGSFKGETISRLLASENAVIKNDLIKYTMGAMPSSGAQQVFDEGSDDVQNVFREQVETMKDETRIMVCAKNRVIAATGKKPQEVTPAEIQAAEQEIISKNKPLAGAEVSSVVTAEDISDLLRRPDTQGGKYGNANLASWFTGQGRHLLGLPKREGKKKKP